MTLDAGGTNFHFSAVRGGKPVTETVSMPSRGDHLEHCLADIVAGFERVKALCPSSPDAISFAFPGPADYPNGIIGDLGNLPGFRGGVALGPMLEDKFGIPTFINNDGNLFVYGEAIAGYLPYVNGLLEQAGSPRRFATLFGVTLGTGFGAGLVINGKLHIGDNSGAGEAWLLRNKLDPAMNAEEGVSIRAVQRVYAEEVGMPFDQAPEPKTIFDIGMGNAEGNQQAAVKAFQRMGEVTGDALATATTLLDGLVVIGGGVSGAWPLFLPAVVDEMNGVYIGPSGNKFPRQLPKAFNLEDPAQLETFLQGDRKEITIPGTDRRLQYDPLARIGLGMSRLGTSEAVAIGAYAFALQKLGTP